MRRAVAWTAAIALLLVGGYFAAVYVVSGTTPAQMLFGPTPDELKALGQPVVGALWRYRAEFNEYPTELKALHIEVPTTVYGPFRYKVAPDGESFQFCIGQLLRDGFVLCHDGVNWHLES